MDLKELKTKWRSLQSEMEGLSTPPDDVENPEEWTMPAEAEARFDEVVAEIEHVEGRIKTVTRQQETIRKAEAVETDQSVHRSEAGFSFSMRPDPYDVTSIPIDSDVNNLRARIETALERDKVTPAEFKEGAMRTMAQRVRLEEDGRGAVPLHRFEHVPVSVRETDFGSGTPVDRP